MTLAQIVFTFLCYGLGAVLLAGAVFPGIWLGFFIWQSWQPVSAAGQAFSLSLGFGAGFFLFGLTLCLETVLLRFLLGLKLREGEFPYFSLSAVKWGLANALTLVVKIFFMDFMKLTPLAPLYYRLMGAKIGRRVQINSSHIADVSLIEIGDDSTVGGDAVILGHVAEHGLLKLRKTRIGKKVTVGLESVVMPGCVIGDGALIAARSVLPKNTQVPPKALFAGTPAQFVRELT